MPSAAERRERVVVVRVTCPATATRPTEGRRTASRDRSSSSGGGGGGSEPGMEEQGAGERAPVNLRCADQPELLSLIISGQEEATQEGSDLGGKEKNN